MGLDVNAEEGDSVLAALVLMSLGPRGALDGGLLAGLGVV